jgi:hypothetical protein
MNTILFFDPKSNKPFKVKVTQSKIAIWRGQGITRAAAFREAKRRGWVHVTTKTKIKELQQ